MSPASEHASSGGAQQQHNNNNHTSWVGIIFYLTLGNEEKREEITQLFLGPYSHLMRQVGQKIKAVSHWAKLEAPTTKQEWNKLQTLDRRWFSAGPIQSGTQATGSQESFGGAAAHPTL